MALEGNDLKDHDDCQLPIKLCRQPRVKDAPRKSPIDLSKHPHIDRVFLDALSIRLPVFVDEQKVSADNELDEDDQRSYHVVLYSGQSNSSGRELDVPICTLRFVEVVPSEADIEQYGKVSIPSGSMNPTLGPLSFISGAKPLPEPVHYPSEFWDGREPYIKIGRVATLKTFRKMGMAAKVLQWTFSWILQNQHEFVPEGNTLVLVHAQSNAQNLYAQQGFVVDKTMGVWVEEGIDHVGMWKRLKLEESAFHKLT